MIDLHTHSSCSDGTDTPEELILSAIKNNITVLALTDHDTVEGLDRASKKAQEAGIHFIPGIELEIEHEYPGEFHMLGLDLKKWKNNKLAKTLENIKKERHIRNLGMIELIKRDGHNITFEKLDKIAGGDIIARPHFARFLVEEGISRSVMDAFSNYLKPGKPYYLPKIVLGRDEAIQLIHEAGGLAFIAHPLSLYVSWGRFPSIFDELKEAGIDGIEAFHSGAKKSQANRLAKMAEERGLLISGGSDYHGANRKDRKLGRGPGGKKLLPPLGDCLIRRN